MAASSSGTKETVISDSLRDALTDENCFKSFGEFYYPQGVPREDAGGGRRLPKRHRLVLEELATQFYDADTIKTLLVKWQEKKKTKNGGGGGRAGSKSSTKSPSLRLLDWYVTNYTKKHQICWYMEDGKRRSIFQAHVAYKTYLNVYKRKLFDVFQRRTRVFFQHPDTKEWTSTTIAQMNFMRWAHEHRVLEHLERDQARVEQHMNETLQKNRERKKKDASKGTKRKRSELSTAPQTSHCMVLCADTTSTFVSQAEF